MLRTALFIGIVTLPFAADAQSYRCVGTDGKKYYGQSVPPQCPGKPVEELNSQGLVSKHDDAIGIKMLALVLAAGLALAPFAAEAQSYRCTGKDGKKYYGQSVPPQCLGMPVEVLNAQGMVTKRYDASASAAEREKKAAEEEERHKREMITKEEGRRNRALLATYTNEKDIENARGRALEENHAAVKDVEGKIAALKLRRADLVKELDFYQGKNKPPLKLVQDITNSEIDLKAQEGL